jgi:hypothetical protein
MSFIFIVRNYVFDWIILISSVRLWSFSKETEDKWAKQALKETEILQAADYDVGPIETGSISYISNDSRMVNKGNNEIIAQHE